MPHEALDHTADLRIRIWGDDMHTLFSDAADALFEQIVGCSDKCGEHKTALQVSGYDLTDLFVNWLRELLYFWTNRSLIVTKTLIEFRSDTSLAAEIFFTGFDHSKQIVLHDIKAVTYHGVAVKKGQNGLEATVIFDV